MIIQVLHCPNCQGTDIVRHGKTRQGKQRYCCREKRCTGRTFLLEYAYAGQSPEVKQQIIDMAMNASGIRDTARVLHISPNTVMAELKRTIRSKAKLLLHGMKSLCYGDPAACNREAFGNQEDHHGLPLACGDNIQTDCVGS